MGADSGAGIHIDGSLVTNLVSDSRWQAVSERSIVDDVGKTFVNHKITFYCDL